MKRTRQTPEQVHSGWKLSPVWSAGSRRSGTSACDQLDYYLDEFTFRFNRRHSRHRGLLFYRLLEQAVATDPHPYKALKASNAA
jgi:hypothetical protein